MGEGVFIGVYILFIVEPFAVKWYDCISFNSYSIIFFIKYKNLFLESNFIFMERKMYKNN